MDARPLICDALLKYWTIDLEQFLWYLIEFCETITLTKEFNRCCISTLWSWYLIEGQRFVNLWFVIVIFDFRC